MKKPTSQFDLFSLDTPLEDEMSDTEQKHLAYYLTNQNNLLEIISSGYLKPRSLMTKYYDDLAQFCPDGIPLLLVPPSRELISKIINLEENFYPVLVEVNLSGMSGTGYLIDKSYEMQRVDLPDIEEGLCLIVQHAIPIDQVNVTYFRQFSDLKDYQLRVYENVPQGVLQYQPAQDKFINLEDDFTGLSNVLSKVNDELSQMDPAYPMVLDSIAGGQLLVMKLSEIEPRVPLDCVAPLLNQSLGILRRRSKKWVKLPAGYEWIELISSVLPESHPRYLGLDKFFKQSKKSGVEQAENLEWLLAGVTMQQLAWVDRLQFSPEETVTDIFSKFIDLLGGLKIDNIEEVIGVYSKIQETIIKVREGLEDLNVFLGTFPTDVFPATTALLLFVMRIKPELILSLKDMKPELPDRVLVMVSLFSGILTGRTKLAVEQRPERYSSTRFVDGMVVRLINLNEGGISLSQVAQPIMIETVEKGEHLIEIMSIGKDELLEREMSPVVDEIEEKIPLKIEAVSQPGAPIPKTVSKLKPEKMSLREILLAADLTSENTPDYQIALEICKILFWLDLVSTVIPLEDRDYILEHRKGRMEFRVPGYLKPQYRLRNQEEFKERLKNIREDDLKKLTNAGIDKKLERD